jgi:glycosyl transferase family 25
MRIYVLSLKGSKRRVEFSLKNKILNQNFEFFDAINGKNLSDDYINKINSSTLKYNRLIGRNEIACADSHIAIYNDMKEKKQEWAIILEDDVIVNDSILDICKTDLTHLKKTGLYILGGQEGLVSKDMIITSSKSKLIISENLTFSKTIASSKYIYRTCGYLINTDLIERIINFRKKCFFLADDWHYLFKNKIVSDIYLANCVIHPIDLNSSAIQAERSKKTTLLQKVKESKLRKIKIAIRKLVFR